MNEINDQQISINIESQEKHITYYTKIVTYLSSNLSNISNIIFYCLLSYAILHLIIVICVSDFRVLFGYKTILNNWAFQSANLFLCISYSSSNIMILRCVLCIAGICFIIWGWNLNFGDTVAWNLCFVIVNAQRAIILFWNKRPIKFEKKWHDDFYKKVFKQIMERRHFKILLKFSLERELLEGRYYARVNDKCTRLSCIIHGQINIIHKNNIQNIINKFEWINSPMYFSRMYKDRYDIDIMATTNCKYITWSVESLYEMLKINPRIKNILEGVLGVDIAHKLFSHRDQLSNINDVSNGNEVLTDLT